MFLVNSVLRCPSKCVALSQDKNATMFHRLNATMFQNNSVPRSARTSTGARNVFRSNLLHDKDDQQTLTTQTLTGRHQSMFPRVVPCDWNSLPSLLQSIFFTLHLSFLS